MPRDKNSITSLYADFERAAAAYVSIPDAEQKRWERALAKADKIAKQIVKMPAATVDEMLLKIRVTGWSVGARYKELEELDNWQPDRFTKGEEFDALVSLRGDLRRLKKAA